MTPEEKTNKLLAIFNRVFKTHYTDLHVQRHNIEQWDSMKHVELIINIQNEFKTTLNIQDIIEIKSLDEFLALV